MTIGIIGGSGLYNIEALKDKKEVVVETPYGSPSDVFIVGVIGDIKAVFLARHGRTHNVAPHQLNHRANIYAMKKLGVEHIISLSAVGSFKEDLAPLDFVIVDQYVDKTKKSIEHTFFYDGVVAHVSFGHPVCTQVLDELYVTASEVLDNSGLINQLGRCPKAHKGGTYVNMEGPAFSTKAESLLHKSWGMDVIGMTNLGEARLAREAEISYNTVAMVTDFDAWHEDEGPVDIEMVIGNLKKNAENASKFVERFILKLANLSYEDPARTSLATGLFTPIEFISTENKQRLEAILSKYY